jgi:eukaryotic-like serine/threonine-protein kinase
MNPKTTPNTTKKEPASLRTPGPLSLVLLRQEQAWRNGTRVPLEQLVDTLPNDLSSVDNILCLISNEVYLRESAGETPNLAEYQQRFPSLAEALEIQWGIDHLWSLKPNAVSNHADTTGPSLLGSLIDERYRVQHLLGRGGMGIVYKALDTKLNRVVAIKCLKSTHWTDSNERARFRTEASSIAKLAHPNIVQIYDIGELVNEAYISMECCDSGSLADWLRHGPLIAKCAADLCSQIASGIASAHAVHVVHRDLKPGNILLTHRPDRENTKTTPDPNHDDRLDQLPDWLIPKVADFGLAKQIDVDHSQTKTGDIVGTPAYMAPEQIADSIPGQEHLIDIYSIGAILYECLTGRPPIRGSTILETLQLLRTQEPVRIRLLQPLVPVDLETIAHKCLQRDPLQRYLSAAELAKDLQRFLQGEPIHARPTPAVQRLIKWARRRPALAATSAIAVTALMGLAITWGVFTQRLTIAKNLAESERTMATKQRDRAERNAEWAMQAVDELITKVADQRLANVPGMDATRRSLLESAVQFCKKFQDDSDHSDPDARNQVALSHRRLAKIYRSLGETEAWHNELESAAKIHRELASEYPTREDYLSELGKTLNNLANVLAAVQGPDASIAVTEEAIAIKENLVKQNPQSQAHRSSLATSLYAIGPKYRVSSPEKAEASYQRSEEIWCELLREDPNNQEFLNGASGLYKNLISLLIAQGRPEEALPLLDKRESILRSQNNGSQDYKQQQQRLDDLYLRSVVLIHTRRHEQAMDVLQEQRALIKRLMSDFPNRLELANQSLQNSFNLGIVYRELGDHAQAIEIGNEGLEIVHEWLKSSPSHPEAISWELRMRAVPMAAELERDQAEKSLELAIEADEIIQRFITSENGPPDLIAVACNMLFYKGLALARLGRNGDALANDLESLEQIAKLYKSQPNHADAKRLVVVITANCVLKHLRLGDPESAQRIVDRSQEYWQPDNSQALRLIQALVDAYRGQHNSAIQILSSDERGIELTDIWPDRASVIIAAVCANQVLKDESLAPSQREKLSEEYVALATRELKAAGPNYYDNPFRRIWLHQTQELQNLSKFPELQATIKQLVVQN